MSNYDGEQAIVEMNYQDGIRETASKDYYRNREVLSLKQAVNASVGQVEESARSLICRIGPLQTTAVCAVPA